jgi:hypothetical protein
MASASKDLIAPLFRCWKSFHDGPGHALLVMTPRGLSNLALAAVLGLGGLSCTSTNGPPSPPSPSASPAFCESEDATRSFVTAFLDDYNAGRPGLADRFFADETLFKWYSERPGRFRTPAYYRSTLEAYLLQRHSEGDHLSLVSVHLSDGKGNFSFVVSRNGVDLPSKAHVDCASRKLTVWSLGPDPGPEGP